MTAKYLDAPELETLIAMAKGLRKGQKLNPHAKAQFVILVDGGYIFCKTEKTLRKELASCLFPPIFRTFRNADKGVSIDLNPKF